MTATPPEAHMQSTAGHTTISISRRAALLAKSRWVWMGVPALAIVAYAPALAIGFLSDDWELLYRAREGGFDPGALLPNPRWPSYRPFGVFVTWQLGWQLFGANPLPFHIVSLLLHAVTSLILGLCAATLSGSRWLGWLVGAIFAVFPLHMEAVGWVAAQWDIWATLFGIVSMLLFASWWRDRNGLLPYLGALAAFTLGVFTKESLLTFLPLILISALLARRPQQSRDWARLAVAMVPFAAALLLNVVIRFLVLGRLGGYVETRQDLGNFVWEFFASHLRVLLAPVAELTYSGPAPQVVGAMVSAALLVGLAAFGRARLGLVLLALVWVVLTIVPVLNLVPSAPDLQQNRLLYLPAAGYALLTGTLLYEAIKAAGRFRSIALALAGALLFAGVATAWLQLRTWHVATDITRDLRDELRGVLPAAPVDRPATLLVENTPDNFRGAYIFRVGLGEMLSLSTGQATEDVAVPSAQSADLAGVSGSAFALRFGYDPSARRHRIAYAGGISDPQFPKGPGPQVEYSFTGCDRSILDVWVPQNARARCEPGRGLILEPEGTDPQLGGTVDLGLPSSRGFVRVGVVLTHRAVPPGDPPILEWFWRGEQGGFSEANRRSLPIRTDGRPYTYWTFIPISDVGTRLGGLRLDPTSSASLVEIGSITVDIVPLPR
jgi:hypothetical protein